MAIKRLDDKLKQGKIRTKLRLSEIEQIIRRLRIVVPPPNRRTLQNMCEDGTFETAGGKPGRIGWLVYEDSFWEWVKSLDGSFEIPASQASAPPGDEPRKSS